MSTASQLTPLTRVENSSIENTWTNSELTDIKLVQLWLRDKSSSTQRKSSLLIKRFFDFINKPLPHLTDEDLYAYSDNIKLHYPNAGTRKNHITSIKSLLRFGHLLGYLPHNSGEFLKVPKIKNDLAERIVSQEQIMQMIALEENPRNQLIIKLLYATGIRNEELCRLKWRDVQRRSDEATQIVVYGKGSKTRSIVVPKSLANALWKFRGDATLDDPVFPSKKRKYGGHLDISSIERVVKAARERAGIERPVVPHSFRHAHASHSLEQGAPIHLVRETLGHSSIKITAQYLHVRPEDSSARFLLD
jgi:integrase/recombinase XerD